MNKIRKTIDRYKKGYCTSDLWDIGYWFLETVPKMLDEFAEKTIGLPSEFLIEDNDGEVNDETHDKGMEKWRQIIKEMSNHFKEANNPTKEQNQFTEQLDLYCKGTLEDIINKEETPEEKEVFDKWVKRENEIGKYKEEELKKGMEMFTKYFWNLWW